MKKICSVLLAVLLLAGALPLRALAAEGDLTTSDAGVAFIAGFEGYRQYAYEDGGAWYIGYGTACGADEYPDGVTEEEAEQLLRETLSEMEKRVNLFLRRYAITLEQYQFDALMSLSYNLGTSWINPSYRLCDYLMKGYENYTEAEMVNAIATWCHVGTTPVPGLVTRRLQEAFLFLYGSYENNGDEKYVYLHYEPDGGEVAHSTMFFPVSQAYGSLLTPTKPGQYFQGWYQENGVMLRADDIAVRDMDVTARWGGSPAEDTGTSATPWENPYTDVSEGQWYYHYVKNLTLAGTVSGNGDGTFRPEGDSTAGEALKVILLAAGYEEAAPTGEHWASGYLELALAEGLVSAEQVPDLDAPISRDLVAQIAARAIGVPASEDENPFTDTDSEYVLALYDAGIITGSYDEEGRLVYLPESTIIRAELCAVMWRMYEYVPPAEEPEEPEEGGEPDVPEEPENDPAQSGYILYRDKRVPVLEDVPVCGYDKSLFTYEDGRLSYDEEGVETWFGIDVSSYQGEIDWEAVADDGVTYAFIRVGFRGYTAGTLNLDKYFHQNVQGALDAGLSVGVYFFSQAISEEEAVEEAEYVLDALAGYDIDFPVVFDWEPIGSSSARTNDLSGEVLTDCAIAFCERVAEEGYTPMVYFNQPVGYLQYELDRLTDYDFWYAQYPAADAMVPAMYYDYQIWQYTSSGRVDGVEGNVDLNLSWKFW